MRRAAALALGERIRQARKIRCDNLTGEAFGRQVAEAIGRARAFSNVTVSNWENGRQEPSWEALVAIARLTRLPLEYFAGIGALQDYPAEYQQEPEPPELDPHLAMLLAAVQRFDPQAQRLIIRQAETLLESLRAEHA